jgi:hypothetical protein
MVNWDRAGKQCAAMVAVAVFLSGCTNLRSQLNPELEPIATSPLPVKIGLYAAPEFTRHEQVSARLQTRYVIPIGEGSMKALEQALPMMVREYVEVDSLPPFDSPRTDLAFVLEPQIEAYDFTTPIMGFGYSGDLTLRATLHALDGTPVASWTVEGHGEMASGMGHLTHAGPNGLVADQAIAHAMNRLVENWRDVPEVRAWLRSQGHGTVGNNR